VVAKVKTVHDLLRSAGYPFYGHACGRARRNTDTTHEDFRASITNMMHNSVRRTSVIKVLGREKEGLAHEKVFIVTVALNCGEGGRRI
jgi:hypothetical protein